MASWTLRLPLTVAFVVASIFVSPRASAHSIHADPADIVGEFFRAINENDLRAEAYEIAGDVTIVDDFSPFCWRGPNAFGRWLDEWAVAARRQQITGANLTLVRSPSVIRTRDYAYVTVATVGNFRMAGKPMREPGVFVFTLSRLRAGWRITTITYHSGIHL